ncbi:hypothetical protein BKA67DRAFT_652712 [Truncatella angustata]|uniref:FAD-binding domain-containing protein n=1 Tax=Truncatella angustata TaxID=152316 RepID=A0A9P8UWI4_9PEZI|nr:uncharacterized protein BKA67DRAFT_652712 [Truncatella angustata]KAH6659483.1 hypothetical protein BKA67DRAFT_652712 [Truncatella angustata]KAH8205514.1 hypothetical protein TruAng_000220 [Truncatella angustata]
MADYKDLKIDIVGAGKYSMGGLTTALALARKGFKNITVYENASNLGFVGAGIQLAPNMLRILDRLDCFKGTRIEREATNIQETSIVRGSDNQELANVKMPDIEQRFGYPHMTGHRESLAGGIYEACQKEDSVKFVFGSTLQNVNTFGSRPKFTIEPRGGEPYEVETDVLIGADGIKSNTRYAMLRELKIDAEVEDTGQAAYRIMLTREQCQPYPELLKLLDSNCAMRWIGERRHIVGYPIMSHNIYNLSTAQPDSNFAAATNATYTTKGDKKQMLDTYHDFCPLVQTMLNLVPDGEVCEWRLRSHKPLDQWTYGNVALVGDACHPTLPHLAQGAALAMEDAAVLAETLALTPGGSPDAVARTLRVYELLRKERATTLVNLAALNGKTMHLGEGKAREERDRMFAEAREKGKPVPDKWASPDVQEMIYSHDCMANAGEKFDELYKGL